MHRRSTRSAVGLGTVILLKCWSAREDPMQRVYWSERFGLIADGRHVKRIFMTERLGDGYMIPTTSQAPPIQCLRSAVSHSRMVTGVIHGH